MSAVRKLPSHLFTLIELLFELGAVRIDTKGGFKLAFHTEGHLDAPLSPCYVSLRVVGHKDGTLTRDAVGRIVHALDIVRVDLGLPVKPTWYCGIPDAGLPFGRPLGKMHTTHHLDLVKTTLDGHRTFTFANGVKPTNDDVVLVIDDLISDAVVKKMALDLIGGTGAQMALAVLLDREQGGIKLLRDQGYRVGAAFTLTELFDVGVMIKKMTSEDRDICLNYPRVLREWKIEHGIAV